MVNKYPEDMIVNLDKLTYLLALQLDNNETELIKYKLRYKILSFFFSIVVSCVLTGWIEEAGE